MDRSKLVKVLIVAAFAVPLLVEGYTFLGMVGVSVGAADGPATDTATATPEGPVVDQGEELLADTPQTETLSSATMRAGDSEWTLTLSVAVENTGESPYALSLVAVTTDGGERVTGSASTGSLAPGESETVTTQWTLPQGETVESVTVSVTVDGETRTETVRLANMPVQRVG